MAVYYNEIDPFCIEWLRNLIAAGRIAPGDVDDRDIRTVQPGDLRGYTQHHFFAGIGGWSLALRLAGWPDDRQVWTGSCPCQPFSSAGAAGGVLDERHLWPSFRWLIQEYGPATIIGEQVASADGRAWLSGVRLDLEALGYPVGAADLCSAGIGADHIRQRIYWMAHARHLERGRRHALGQTVAGVDGTSREDASGGGSGDGETRKWAFDDVADGGAGRGMAESDGTRRQETGSGHEVDAGREPIAGRGDVGGEMADAAGDRRQTTGTRAAVEGRKKSELEDSGGLGHASAQRSPVSEQQVVPGSRRREEGRTVEQTGPASFVPCADGVLRRVEPGTFPLAYGIPQGMGRGEPGLAGMVKRARTNRVGRLKGYGNAIDPRVAAEFVRAVM